MTVLRRLAPAILLAASVAMPGLAQAQGLEDLLRRSVNELRDAVEQQAAPVETLSPAERAAVQSALNRLGIDVGSPDGQFGPKTRAGIATFQSDHGFEPTGRLTPEQVDVLLAAAEDPAGDESGVAGVAPATATGEQNAIGLSLRNGEILAASTAISIGDDYVEGLDRLMLLLLLKTSPELLDDRNRTETFARVLPRSVLEQYMQIGRSGIRFASWRGDSEFEREDMRRRFLAEQRDAILALRPDLPLTIVDIRSLSTSEYDFDRQVLPVEVSRYLPWPQDGGYGFNAEVPVSLPDELVLAPEVARAIVEGTVDGVEQLRGNYRPVVALRYEITGLRALDPGVALDIRVLDAKVYANRDLTLEIMDLPLGGNTILADGPDAGDFRFAGAPMLDPLLGRMLAAKLAPALIGDTQFMTESFEIRRKTEAQFASRGGVAPEFNRVMPPVLLNDRQLRATSDDFERFRSWFEQALPQVGDLVTFPRNLASIHGNDPLTAIAGGSGATPNRDNQQLLRDRWPNSVELGYFFAGDERDLTVLYALDPSPHWTNADLVPQLGDGGEALLTVRILESVVGEHEGQRMLLLNVAPHQLNLARHGQWTSVPLPVDDTPSIASASDGSAPVSRFEVLGLRLGMPVPEARALIEDAFPGKQMRLLEVREETMSDCSFIQSRAGRDIRGIQSQIDYQQRLGARPGSQVDAAAMADLEAQLADANAALAAQLKEAGCQPSSMSPLQFAFGFDIVHSSDLTERIAVYQVGELVGTPSVSAIYRQFSADSIGDRFLDGLKQTYGDDFVPMDNGSQQVTWVDDPAQAARFGRNGDERCTSFWRGDDPYPGQYVHVDCGAYLRADYFRMVLIDSRFTSRILSGQMADAAAAEAASEPEIKF